MFDRARRGAPSGLARGRRFLLAILTLSVPISAWASISGFVREAGSGVPGTPIAGALVHIRNDAAHGVLSAADGSFTLATVPPGGPHDIAASVVYDRTAARNYLIGGATASDGEVAVDLRLEVLPTADNPTYAPASRFYCDTCHPNNVAQWETSNHAGAADNEWVLDVYSGTGTPGGGAGYVFRASHDAGETGFCATCHTPMKDVFQPGLTFLDEVTEPVALEGVTCVSCHQMDSVDENNLDALHLIGKSTYRFPDSTRFATSDFVWGPLTDVTFPGMQVSRSPLHRSSLLCASCHQYKNPDTGAPGQNTYREWLASPFAVPGPGFRTCQDCHMPPAADALGQVCVLSPADRIAGDRRQHAFVGSTPDTLAANVSLGLSAFEIAGERVRVVASVGNHGAGHSFPTGVSIRNAILLLEATYGGQPLAQVAGPVVPFWGSDDVAGEQPGDWAGHAGKGFAKVLEGRINGGGPTVRPVLFIDAEGVTSDTAIPSGAIDTTEVDFQLPPGVPPGSPIEVTARLLYRRTFRALQVEKGWTVSAHGGPIEIEVGNRAVTIETGRAVIDVPALSRVGLLALAALLAGFGALLLAGRKAVR